MLAALTVAVLASAPVSSATPQPPRPLQDSVTGSGVTGDPRLHCGGDDRVEVDARSGPSGESPSGHIRCGDLFDGPVDCLSVTGNVALITTVDQFFGRIGVRITDNGTSDRFEAFPAFQTAGAGCPAPLTEYRDIPFAGDLVVVDAPPSPTSQDQCKNGGYAVYAFVTQGQCVAFVQRGPKP